MPPPREVLIAHPSQEEANMRNLMAGAVLALSLTHAGYAAIQEEAVT